VSSKKEEMTPFVYAFPPSSNFPLEKIILSFFRKSKNIFENIPGIDKLVFYAYLPVMP